MKNYPELQSVSFHIFAAGVSDVGCVRLVNEDSWASFEEDNGQLLILADGMGGHRGGKIAAQATVNSLGKWYSSLDQTKISKGSDDQIIDLIKENVEQVNNAVFSMGCQEPELRGMGTTLCCLLFSNDRAFQCHAGDSRIYRFRDQELERLTRDDSIVSNMLELGQLEEEDIPNFKQRNVVTRAVGMEPDLSPHMDVQFLKHHDLFILCSDGLTDLLNDEEIEQHVDTTLKAHGHTQKAVDLLTQQLVDAALERGGKDNVTVVIAAVKEK